MGWKVGLFGFAAVRNPLHMEPRRVLVAGSDARVRFAVIPYAFTILHYTRNSELAGQALGFVYLGNIPSELGRIVPDMILRPCDVIE